MNKKITLFIIDDSAIVRNSIRLIVEDNKKIDLLGFASDPIFAMEKFKKSGMPDVLILDLEMPRMDGLTFLKYIKVKDPVAVIICSGYAEKGSRRAIEALSLGAVDIITKPKIGINKFLEESKRIIIESIYAAAKSKSKKAAARQGLTISNISPQRKQAKESLKKIPPRNLSASKGAGTGDKVIVIGASTGGVQVLESIMSLLNNNTPPILIVQHMPPGFTKSLAFRLNQKSSLTIKEAENGDHPRCGQVLIAPGGKHMILDNEEGYYVVRVLNGPKINHHRPSVGALFRSCVNTSAAHTYAFILTGMSNDGAHEIRQIRDCGGKTYAQDKNSCVVFGMPMEAIKIGGIDQILTPVEIAQLINKIN